AIAVRVVAREPEDRERRSVAAVVGKRRREVDQAVYVDVGIGGPACCCAAAEELSSLVTGVVEDLDRTGLSGLAGNGQRHSRPRRAGAEHLHTVDLRRQDSAIGAVEQSDAAALVYSDAVLARGVFLARGGPDFDAVSPVERDDVRLSRRSPTDRRR